MQYEIDWEIENRNVIENNLELCKNNPIEANLTLKSVIGDISFIFEQGIASDVWVIQHNLNKYPSVSLVDSSGTQFIARIEYINKNKCIIYINGETKGKAYLN